MCTDLHCETQLLVYTEYNNGDSTHPCGALTLIVLIPENVLLILTTCFLFCKKIKNPKSKGVLNPQLLYLIKKFNWNYCIKCRFIVHKKDSDMSVGGFKVYCKNASLKESCM